jgi:outer membrane cobalamin receptor
VFFRSARLSIPLLVAVSHFTVRAQEVIVVPPVRVEGVIASEPASPGDAHPDELAGDRHAESPAGPIRAAATLPGVQVREAGGLAQRASLSVRGADPQGTLVTLDGVPLNSPFLGGADVSGLGLLPLDGIRFLRGGSSASFGTDAIGGVVQARTQSPLAAPGTRASLTVGSFGAARLKALHAARSGSLGGLGSVGILSSSGDFPFTDTNGAGRVRTHNASSALDGLARFDFLAGTDHLFSTLVEGFLDDREIPGMEEFPSGTARQRDRRVIAGAAWEGPALFGRGGSTTARAWGRYLGFSYDDSQPPFGPPVSTRLDVAGFGLELRSEARVAKRLAVIIGATASHDRGFVSRLGGASGNPSRTAIAGILGTRLDCETCAYRVEAVLRVEHDAGFGFRAIPRLDASVGPFAGVRLFGSVSRGFRLPTLEELHFDVGYVRGNPDLSPEDALTWDAGVAWSPLAQLEVQASWYEARVRNLILFLPRSAFVTRAENSGTATLRGVEAFASVRAGPFGLMGTYTFLDARFADGIRMPHRPRHVGGASATLDLPPFSFAVSARAQTAFWLDRFEALHEEGRLVVDTRLELAPHPAVALALDVHNLADKRDAVDFLQYPLPGRAFYGTLKLVL